ncbi:hypothetical protein JW868_02520, partial [Candidatus Woesearchaeota archaeon]|nr:hypothetical protein [Candidatus Woesearchaeota archaeon]
AFHKASDRLLYAMQTQPNFFGARAVESDNEFHYLMFDGHLVVVGEHYQDQHMLDGHGTAVPLRKSIVFASSPGIIERFMPSVIEFMASIPLEELVFQEIEKHSGLLPYSLAIH